MSGGVMSGGVMSGGSDELNPQSSGRRYSPQHSEKDQTANFDSLAGRDLWAASSVVASPVNTPSGWDVICIAKWFSTQGLWPMPYCCCYDEGLSNSVYFFP